MRTIIFTIFGFFSLSTLAQEWRPLPDLETNVWGDLGCLEIYHDTLVVGGGILTINGENSIGVFGWDSLNYSSWGDELSGGPFDFEVYNDELYAEGELWLVYGPGVGNDGKGIAVWQDTIWSHVNAFGSNTTGAFESAQAYHGKLYIGNNFSQIAGLTGLGHVAAWDGESWEDPGGFGDANISSMIIYRDTLLAGGLVNSNDDNIFTRGLAYYDEDSTWHTFHGGIWGIIDDMTVDTINEDLYVCGWFHYAGNDSDLVVESIARWNGSEWESLSEHVFNTNVSSLQMYRGQLYSSGPSYAILEGDTIVFNSFMRYNGVTWEMVGGGMDGGAIDMLVYKDELYLAGHINSVGEDSIPVNNIVRWYMHPDSVTWGVKEPELKLSENRDFILVYPNPNSGLFTVKLLDASSSSQFSKANILVTDMQGKQKFLEPLNGRKEMQINLEYLPTGIYLVSLLDGGIIRETVRVVRE